MPIDETVSNNINLETNLLKEVIIEKTKTVEISKKRTTKKDKVKRFRAADQRRTSAERAAKSHKELTDMITMLYNDLPKTFILHESFVKITKIQKLDQMHKFICAVKHHGYKTS